MRAAKADEVRLGLADLVSRDRPDENLANVRIALLEHKRGHLQQAIRYYEKAVSRSNDSVFSAQLLNNMARAYLDLDDTVRARQCMLSAQRSRLLPLPPSPVKDDGQRHWRHDIRAFIQHVFHIQIAEPEAER